jgi:hypothetical protein
MAGSAARAVLAVVEAPAVAVRAMVEVPVAAVRTEAAGRVAAAPVAVVRTEEAGVEGRVVEAPAPVVAAVAATAKTDMACPFRADLHGARIL